jgi:acyl-CoA thioesterase YciA
MAARRLGHPGREGLLTEAWGSRSARHSELGFASPLGHICGAARENLMDESDIRPTGELTLRTLAMPADANAAGDIFGGWVMAQMDLACGIRAAERAKGRVVTAAVKEMSFASPMKIGDTLCIYTHINRVGRTSMMLKVEAWAQRYLRDLMEKVTDADFVMVALDREGRPTPVPK